MEETGMIAFFRITRSSILVLVVLLGSLQLNFSSSWSLNDEGVALLRFKARVVNDPFGALSSWKEDIEETGHCSWFGIECAHGHVVSLSLKNLCLEGTLTPELRHLLHMKLIILRNNSFSGSIPEEIKNLKELMLLDLGRNNFSEPLPSAFGYSMPILLLDNNGLSCPTSPELQEQKMLSEIHVNKDHRTGTVEVLPYNRCNDGTKDDARGRMLAQQIEDRSPSRSAISSIRDRDHHPVKPHFLPPHLIKHRPPPPPSSSPPPRPKVWHSPPGSLSPSPTSTSSAMPSPSSSIFPSSRPTPSKNTRKTLPIVLGAMSGFIVLVLLILGIFLWGSKKVTTVGPWRTGLSGQLQKAFVTGIPNLKRSELVTACEDFSNVVGSSSIGTIYKGTLSNGVEIAVISLAVTSSKDWSRNLEIQFRTKIETLSKVNHKNFVNLIGYCEEALPFTRMLVFEYAPNGSLFEHVHVKEAEHLDWGMRLRVVMGMAYCLEYMHQLVPPVAHPNLNSFAVSLSEDYAAKLSDFCFWNEVAAAQMQATGMSNLSTSSASLESNVYCFGLVLLEMMTGRIPLSLENSSLEDWVLEYMREGQRLEELVDPMLRHYDPEQLETINEVIRKCLHVDPQQRPAMGEVAARFREITGLDRDKASPRLSPLWWAELEERSVDGD